MKASLTLESTVIYPIILVITFSMIIFSFHLHDKLSIKATSYTYLLKQHQNKDSDIEESVLYNALNKVCLLKTSYIIDTANTDEISITHKMGKISITFTDRETYKLVRTLYIASQANK